MARSKALLAGPHATLAEAKAAIVAVKASGATGWTPQLMAKHGSPLVKQALGMVAQARKVRRVTPTATVPAPKARKVTRKAAKRKPITLPGMDGKYVVQATRYGSDTAAMYALGVINATEGPQGGVQVNLLLLSAKDAKREVLLGTTTKNGWAKLMAGKATRAFLRAGNIENAVVHSYTLARKP